MEPQHSVGHQRVVRDHHRTGVRAPERPVPAQAVAADPPLGVQHARPVAVGAHRRDARRHEAAHVVEHLQETGLPVQERPGDVELQVGRVQLVAQDLVLARQQRSAQAPHLRHPGEVEPRLHAVGEVVGVVRRPLQAVRAGPHRYRAQTVAHQLVQPLVRIEDDPLVVADEPARRRAPHRPPVVALPVHRVVRAGLPALTVAGHERVRVEAAAVVAAVLEHQVALHLRAVADGRRVRPFRVGRLVEVRAFQHHPHVAKGRAVVGVGAQHLPRDALGAAHAEHVEAASRQRPAERHPERRRFAVGELAQPRCADRGVAPDVLQVVGVAEAQGHALPSRKSTATFSAPSARVRARS